MFHSVPAHHAPGKTARLIHEKAIRRLQHPRSGAATRERITGISTIPNAGMLISWRSACARKARGHSNVIESVFENAKRRYKITDTNLTRQPKRTYTTPIQFGNQVDFGS
jgi:hypothetical protein